MVYFRKRLTLEVLDKTSEQLIMQNAKKNQTEEKEPRDGATLIISWDLLEALGP